MKGRLVVFVVVLFVAKTAYATPVFEIDSRANGNVVIDDLVVAKSSHTIDSYPIAHSLVSTDAIRFDKAHRIHADISFDSGAQNAASLKSEIEKQPLATKWAPTWHYQKPQRWLNWLYELQGSTKQNPAQTIPGHVNMLLLGLCLAGMAMVTRRKMKK